MRLEQSFEVDAPPDQVWAALTDVPRVAPCLPGAEISDAGEDGTYHGTFSVRLGPATATYRGTLRMEQLDEAARVATMDAAGKDKRGQGGAKATIVSRMREENGKTHVDVETDLTITGRLAQFGRPGIIQDVSNRLMQNFANCLQASLAPREAEPDAVAEAGGVSETARVEASGAAPPAPAEPVRGITLLFSVLWERVRKFFGRLFRRGG
jgi:hypothetical protein